MTSHMHKRIHQYIVLVLSLGVGWIMLTPPALERPTPILSAPLAFKMRSSLAADHWLSGPVFRPDRAPILQQKHSTIIAEGESLFRLHGIMIWNGKNRALITDQHGNTRTIMEGDTLGEWRVEHIDDLTVQLKSMDETIRIEMRGDGHE